MTVEVNLIKEYESIIRTMKEQITVLKGKAGKEQFLDGKSYRSQIKGLEGEVKALREVNRKLTGELTSYQLGVSQSAQTERSQLQEKLLYSLCSESELQRIKAQEQAKTLTSILHELHDSHKPTNSELRDFDRDVELYLQGKKPHIGSYLQTKITALERENGELRERVATLEEEMQTAMERLQGVVARTRSDALEKEVEMLQRQLKEKEDAIAKLTTGRQEVELSRTQLEAYKEKLKQTSSSSYKSGTRSELTSPRNPLYTEVRLSHNPTPRSSSAQQKLAKRPVRPLSQLSSSTAEVSGDQSARYESILDRYQRKWARPQSVESQQLTAIKEQLGATQHQLHKLVSGKQPQNRSQLLQQLKVKRPR